MSDGAPVYDAEVATLAAEALRHLEWLAAAGVRELPGAPLLEQVRPAPQSRPRQGEDEGLEAPRTTERRAHDTLPHDARSADAGAALQAIRGDLGDCTRCKLSAGRQRLVFGVGNPQAELVFVGEGPGEEEDRQGEPFVGRAGQLLTRMIEAMGYERAEVYIANVVKCRPPGNRNPEPEEIEACEPFLRAQLAAIRPRVIVALGKFAAQTLLRSSTPISRLRGRWHEYEGVKLMPTFHPAYLLRSPDEKKKAWEDLQLVMKELGRPLPRR
ncbi:MAG TPA: uracil-DNA glycosylase [Anaeromyxobacter sp.]|nr:uracil-DNA glycosylase [Anaeromyxobacter sp.]